METPRETSAGSKTVVPKKRSTKLKPKVSHPKDPYEREADSVATKTRAKKTTKNTTTKKKK